MDDHKMASKRSDGVAECSVCLNIYTDPRMLPACGHSFCLKCIKQSAKTNDHEVECPLCRKLFSVTAEGFEGLPVNYALISVIENLSQNNCRKAPNNDAEQLDNVPSNYCTIHQHEELVLVCDDCWTPVCVRCLKDAHSGHNMKSLRKFLEKAVKILQNDAKEEYLIQIENQRRESKDNKVNMLSQITDQELAINREYESIKLHLEQERNGLIEELHSIKQSVLKKTEHCDNELETQEQSFRSLHVLIEEMAEDGKSVANFDKVHHLREVKESLNHVIDAKLELGQKELGLSFLPADLKSLILKFFPIEKNSKMLGNLQLNSTYCEPTVFCLRTAFTALPPKSFGTSVDSIDNFREWTSWIEADNICLICMDTITDAKVLPCKHKFCRECIDNCFKKHQPKCPSCGKVFGIMKGNQPPGSMSHSETNYQHLPGYPGCGTIEIHYSFRSGTQQENHPNPGQPYRGTNRTAFLPGNKEGQEVLRLLKRAFDSGLVFTIGRSNTTGQENVVIWNDVHHKTSPHGQYGYPDPTYLKRVKEELAAKGIQ